MRYVIYGAGGIGCVIGARLFQHGSEVVLIARGEHLRVIREEGLTFKTPHETVRLPIPAVGHPTELRFSDGDVVLLTMKSQDTESALSELVRAGGELLPVVCAQNGVDNERMALRRFRRVYGMLVWVPAVYLESGFVLNHATPASGVLDAGCFPHGVDDLIANVTKDLDRSGFSSRVNPDIMPWKYAKLLSNVLNSFVAACGEDARSETIIRALKREALECYRAVGVGCVSDDEFNERVASHVRLADIEGHPKTGGSTWQSLQRGRDTVEADHLNGEIVLLGRLHGVPTPCNEVLQQLANRLARTGRPPGSVSVEELERRLSVS